VEKLFQARAEPKSFPQLNETVGRQDLKVPFCTQEEGGGCQ